MGEAMEGTIIKGYSGFYYVIVADGHIYECSLRGKNRQKKVRFLPGDRVEITAVNERTGAIESVLPRKTELLRPAIANVDQLVILVAMADPLPDLQLVDRLTIFALWNGIAPVLCFNKADLVSQQEQQRLEKIYQPAGFPLYFCSAETGAGIVALKEQLKGKISALAGNSGVGKSSMLNALNGGLLLQATGEVSDRLKRGKHTTRHVELFDLGNQTLIADTPGFSVMQLPEDLKREELSRLFPEFMRYLGNCKFATCLHNSEPQCAIKEGVDQGILPISRYEHYLVFLEEVIAQERSF